MAFSVDVMVQGYVYNNVWTAVVKEELSAKNENSLICFLWQ